MIKLQKKALLSLGLLLTCMNAIAIDFTTSGEGNTYNLEKLSLIERSGVSKNGDQYVIDGTITIAGTDSFKIDEGVIVEFCDGAELILQGPADLRAMNSRTRLTRHDDISYCYGINVQSPAMIEVANLDFEYVGLRGNTSVGMNVRNCSFTRHNGNASGALFLGGSGAVFQVEGCHFELCQKAAIGGAANYFCPVTINNCSFVKNSQANGNIPQLNLTSASDITISNCTVEGDSTLNMVGGIAISNFYGYDGQHVKISGCTICDNRYGITTLGVMDVRITDNMIINNHFETNPNNGGSGISLYDPYMKQRAYIAGNHIEKNLWGITVIGCGYVDLGTLTAWDADADYSPGNNVFKDNGFEGALYDLYNNSTNPIFAQGNIWNVDIQDEEHIEEVIFHKHDNEALGEVFFMPAGNPEGIVSPQRHQQSDGTIYHITGQKARANGALPHGIYIINGKKVVK